MSFATDSLRTFIVRSSLIFITVLGGIICARWLGPEGVGIMALSALIQTFALRFGNFGFGSGFSFFIARGKTSGKKVLGLAFGLCMVVSVVSIAILLLIWRDDFSPWQKMPPTIFYLSLAVILPSFMNLLLSAILSGYLDIKATNISEIIRTVCFISLLAVFVVILNLGVLGAVCADLMAQLVDFFYLLSRVRRKQDTPVTGDAGNDKMRLVVEIWRYGRWNYLLMFFNFYIGELPLIFLSYFYPYNIVGFFSIGRGLLEKSRILPNAFSQALFPYTAASEEKVAVNRTNTLCRNFLVISGCTVTVLIIIIKPLILLLYGKSFLPVIPVFYALIPAIILWPFSQFLTVHVAAFGNPKKVLLRSLCTLPVCVIACVLFIPRYGAIGAACSVSTVYVILAALSMYIYIRFTGAHLSEILFLRADDIDYYRGILKLSIKRFKNQASKL